MFSTAQRRCLPCAGDREMRYAGKKKKFIYSWGETLCGFFFLITNTALLKKGKEIKAPQNLCVSEL